MTTIMRTKTNPSEDQGTVTISSRAGRLLFALLLLPGTVDSLSMLANVPRKMMPACVDELTLALETQEQSPDPENAVGAKETNSSDAIITHGPVQIHREEYLTPTVMDPLTVEDPEDAVAEQCRLADEAGDTRAQALAVIGAWQYFYPNVNKVQELQLRKAKEWVKVAGSATSVFGIMTGVEERLVVEKEFPLAYLTKIIGIKAKEAEAAVEEPGEAEDKLMDAWRVYARKTIEQGANRHVGKNIQANLERITSRIQGSATEP